MVIETFHAHSAREWRKWLEKNSKKKDRIFLTKYKKHTKKPTISHQEAMDEAICFGWIDTTARRVDEDVWGTVFVKRNKNSRWSKNTLKYARRLIRAGKMTPAGLNAYKLGSKKPLVDHGLPKDHPPPEDLIKALSRYNKTLRNFQELAPSMRFMYIVWVERAKMKETRKRRIGKVVELMKEVKVKKKRGKY